MSRTNESLLTQGVISMGKTVAKSKNNFVRRASQRNHGVPGKGFKSSYLFHNFHTQSAMDSRVIAAFSCDNLADISRRLRNYRAWTRVRKA